MTSFFTLEGRSNEFSSVEQPQLPKGPCLEVLSQSASKSMRVASRPHRGLPRGFIFLCAVGLEV